MLGLLTLLATFLVLAGDERDVCLSDRLGDRLEVDRAAVLTPQQVVLEDRVLPALVERRLVRELAEDSCPLFGVESITIAMGCEM